jgi:hypothetical protein
MPAKKLRPRTAKGAAPRRSSPAASARAPKKGAAPRAQLVAVLRALGARDPDAWARSDDAGVLERFVLLRALWMRVVEPGKLLARAKGHAHVGAAVDRLMGKADLADLDALVRLAQEQALTDILTVLDDPADDDGGVSWGVFHKDAKGKAVRRLGNLARDLDLARP